MWTQIDTMYCFGDGPTTGDKVAGFDMDDTLITTVSGAKFAADSSDWKFVDPSVAPRLVDLHREGYKIVIFTNQKGITVGKTPLATLKTKIGHVIKALGVPVFVCMSSDDDIYRKPRTGMWDATCGATTVGVDVANSFYVGDAAGRKGDFSASDYKFALNVGLKFFTPESFFLGDKTARGRPAAIAGFDPRTLLDTPAAPLPPAMSFISLPAGQQEVVVLVGSPAAGKSTWCRQVCSVAPHYRQINQDTLKTKKKCQSAAQSALDHGDSVIIDATNRDVKTRDDWIKLARQYNVPARAVVLKVDKDVCFHLNAYRGVNPRTADRRQVPSVIIHSFFKQYQHPTTTEGFADVVQVPVSVNPTDSDDRRLLTQFLVSK
eukprot:GILJ01018880.1.p1 GENE.GILJ01018880.1~~GILJ01018880.1.p1  ORF type:complete len:376 (-),score=52.85 GILJ01018880.1:168-1295(-)